MVDIHDFDDIRPFLPEELPEVFDRLIKDESFQNVIKTIHPDVPVEKIAELIRSCKSNYEFQLKLIYPILEKLLSKASTGMTSDYTNINKCNGFTFVSNHRDIVLDSALLDVTLINNGYDTVEIAIGDNLLVFPWIKDLVRVNRSFIVQRALTMRQMLMASAKMSRYMHYVIKEKQSNLWIAQREGRAKDSNDLTQESVIKMMAMGGESKDVIENLKEMNIVPLAISYEYDPCDYLKAEEFQNKRDIEGFKKSQQDDLDNMRIGIFGYKGHIHYHAAPCINDWLDGIDPNTPKTDLFRIIAEHIDQEIHKNYRLYPCNKAALSLLDDKYINISSDEERAAFEKYLESKMKQITLKNPDYDFLRNRLLTMYAYPALNQIKALG
ncbi:MAG: acyltransferase [Bacteroidaceae bacterium]|nr:acyltransferase [Bacteroidaceae bacterium]